MGASTSKRSGLGRAGGTWALTGLLLSFGIASLPSIGWFLLLGAAVLIIIAVVRRLDVRALPAALLGAGLTPLYIAIINRRGPGMFCARTTSSLRCGEQYDPWPFTFAGLVLLLLGTTLLLALHRRGTRSAPEVE